MSKRRNRRPMTTTEKIIHRIVIFESKINHVETETEIFYETYEAAILTILAIFILSMV